MIGHGRAVFEVARKEALQLVRTKRLLGVSIALLLTMILMTFAVPLMLYHFTDATAPVEYEWMSNFVLMFFLTGFLFLSGYFFLQLMPILLTSDAVCSEWQDRTIFLLLSKPVGRTAFVLGKYLGIALPLAALTAVLLLLNYLALFAFWGLPSGEAVVHFFGALGLICLGVMAFSAMALFFSTITRSSVAALILAIVAWVIVLPLLGNLGTLIGLAEHGPEQLWDPDLLEDAEWSRYLSPGSSMDVASAVLIPDGGEFFGALGSPSPWGAALALCVHAALFVGSAVWIVNRRNFE